MKKHLINPLLALLLATGLHGTAQAAYFDYVGHVGSGGYSALTEGVPVDDAVLDLSSPPSSVTLFGSKIYSGTLEHSYAADAFLDFSELSTDLSMSLSHSLTGVGADGFSIASHQQDAFVDLTAVTMKLTGQGEAMGSDVRVTFQGAASALYDVSGGLASAYLGLGLSVQQGETVVGEYLWDVSETADRDIAFSFIGKVGEEYILSAYMLSGASLENTVFVPSESPYLLVDAGAQLTGNLTVAAVPEPETFALLLAGLGLVGYKVRRRRAAA